MSAAVCGKLSPPKYIRADAARNKFSSYGERRHKAQMRITQRDIHVTYFPLSRFSISESHLLFLVYIYIYRDLYCTEIIIIFSSIYSTSFCSLISHYIDRTYIRIENNKMEQIIISSYYYNICAFYCGHL